MKSIKQSKVILERGYVEDTNSTDEYVQPADQPNKGAGKKQFVVYMDVSQVNKDGKKLRPASAGFTNSPFPTYEEAIKQAGIYAKQKYPNDTMEVDAGDPGKNDGFILIQSNKVKEPNDKSQYIIKFWVKHTDYYHGDAPDTISTGGSDTSGKVRVLFFSGNNVTRPSNDQLYPSEDAAIRAIKQVATQLQRTLYKNGSVVNIQDKSAAPGSAVVVKDMNGIPCLLIAIAGTIYPKQGKFVASNDKSN